MQVTWQKGSFSWIASRPDRPVQPDERFPLSEAPATPAIGALSEKLLDYGGEAVVILFVEEPVCGFLLEQGQISTHHSISFETGEPSECHANSARLWRARQDELHLVTGYGLSDDNLWRRHSWLINKEQTLIETTQVRVKYFGLQLSEKQASSFSVLYLDL